MQAILDSIPYCIFTLQSHPSDFIAMCSKAPQDQLYAWANDHFLEVDPGGMYMRFHDCEPDDFRRIRIKALFEEPFDTDGELKEAFKSRVYKPILLAKPDAEGGRWMQLDNKLRVKYFAQPEFSEWMAPSAVVE
jgi:hypothetical protein